MKSSRTGRFKTSVWVDRENWKWFVPWARSMSSSSCELIDAFVYSCRVTQEKISVPKTLPNVEVHLTLAREVQKPRTRGRVGPGPTISEWGTLLKCYRCKREARYMVYYSPGVDKTIRAYVCGYHVRRFRRMTSRAQSYPRVKLTPLYRGGEGA